MLWHVEPTMIARWLRLICLWLLPMGLHAESGPDHPAVPDVESAIPPAVKALGEPSMMPFADRFAMAVSAAEASAQERVIQGIRHLHGGWDFEASRHFAVAMRTDPECLLAHWGMFMCLLAPGGESSQARAAVADRMMELLVQGKGTPLEQGYAKALMTQIRDGPAAAANVFEEVSRQYPNDLQSTLFAVLFARDGYDEFGDAREGQRRAEERIARLMEAHPSLPMLMNAALMIRAEAPDVSGSVDLARQLCELLPGYPPARHLLGHFEWRCGRYEAARDAFAESSALYRKWMGANGATIADCPEWLRSECYRIVCRASLGEHAAALDEAMSLAKHTAPVGREASPGARMLMWEARTLPARILIDRAADGDFRRAAESLPSRDELAKQRAHSMSGWWIESLRLIAEAMAITAEGSFEEARSAMQRVESHFAVMQSQQAESYRTGERSEWLRALEACRIFEADLRSRLAKAGPAPLRSSAFNWLSSAADMQRHAVMLMPPAVLTTMASRLGDHCAAAGDSAAAEEAYLRALAFRPGDRKATEGLAKLRVPSDSAPADSKDHD
jgi:hypothetical protein